LNVSERKRDTTLLSNALAHLSAVIESTQDHVWSVDLHYRLVTFNKAFQESIKRNFGNWAEVGMLPEEVASPARAVEWRRWFERALSEGVCREEIHLADGKTLELVFSRIVQEGIATGIAVFGEDITKRRAAEKALLESEKKYREILDSSHIGFYRTTPEGQVLMVNPALVQMLGCESADEVLKWNLEGDHFNRNYLREEFKKAVEEKGMIRGLEAEWKRLDGTTLCVRESARAMRDGSGKVIFYEGTIEDITETKEAEARYQEIFDGALEGIYRTSLEGESLLVNPAAVRMLGYTSAEEYLSANSGLIVGLWAEQRERSDFIKLLRVHGAVRGYECRLIRKDGAIIWASLTSQLVCGEKGKALYIEGFIEDITERKLAEEAARRSAAELKEAQRIAHIGNWTLDLKTGYCTWSDEMFRMRGLDPSQSTPPLAEQERNFSPESWARLNAAIEKTAHTGVAYELELELVLPDGRAGWALSRGEAVRDASGEIVGLRGVAVDISARKRAEAEKALLEAKFVQAQKLEAVARLAGGIAHDFNNLLTIIMGNTELLPVAQQSASVLRVEKIMKASKRAAELTGQLLAFSRRQTTQPTVTSMNQAVTGVSRMLRQLVGEDVEIKIVLHDKAWKVKTDQAQLEQAIVNLVVNAHDAMPNGGRLTLETANVEIGEEDTARRPLMPEGKYAMLSVSDTGAGMSAETQARLFEPFFTTKAEGQGTGLGLSMVYGIVKHSGGFIWAYSELGEGTSFKIYLPMADVNEDVEQSQSVLRAQPIRKRATILLVEDEESLREVITEFLRSGGHKVVAAGSLDEACQAALERRLEIELLLTDVVLKGGNANQLVDRLEEQACAFPALYMSGYTPDAIVHHGVLEPGVMFLQKPFSRTVLLDKVEEVLSRDMTGRD
jgi:PAS domain S-box-containing protein